VRRRWLPVIVALPLPAAGCGGEEATGPEAPRSAKVDIASFKFMPERARVRQGGRVTFVNQDEAPHNAEAEDGSFDTVRQELGEKKAVSLDQPGTYEYFCRFHRFMNGTVEVVE